MYQTYQSHLPTNQSQFEALNKRAHRYIFCALIDQNVMSIKLISWLNDRLHLRVMKSWHQKTLNVQKNWRKKL